MDKAKRVPVYPDYGSADFRDNYIGAGFSAEASTLGYPYMYLVGDQCSYHFGDSAAIVSFGGGTDVLTLLELISTVEDQ